MDARKRWMIPLALLCAMQLGISLPLLAGQGKQPVFSGRWASAHSKLIVQGATGDVEPGHFSKGSHPPKPNMKDRKPVIVSGCFEWDEIIVADATKSKQNKGGFHDGLSKIIQRIPAAGIDYTPLKTALSAARMDSNNKRWLQRRVSQSEMAYNGGNARKAIHRLKKFLKYLRKMKDSKLSNGDRDQLRILASDLIDAILNPPHVLMSGKILFAAHGTTDGQAPLQLFVSDANGSDCRQISGWLVTGGEDYSTPDIAKAAGGGWRIAWGTYGIRMFDMAIGATAWIEGPGATRADFSSDANTIVYQSGTTEINLWQANYDGSSITQLTNVAPGNNAEWPYFVSQTGQVLFFATYGPHRRHVIDTDGSNEQVIAAPGGDTGNHLGMKADGSEFVNSTNLTSYLVSTGATGTINDLKHTTSLLSQLSSLGFEEVPMSLETGEAKITFPLSVDWSEDGTKLVFDGLVRTRATGQTGIAIFTFDLADNKLALVYGPEPLEPSRTRNYNYSIHTPKWIP